MSVHRIMGLETEYGISVPGQPMLNAMVTSSQIVNAYAHLISHGTTSKARWDYDEESPLRDARGFDMSRSEADASQWTDGDLGLANVILPNGARLYVDHAHPEYSTPEVTNPRDAVLWDRAGVNVMNAAADAAAAAPGGELSRDPRVGRRCPRRLRGRRKRRVQQFCLAHRELARRGWLISTSPRRHATFTRNIRSTGVDRYKVTAMTNIEVKSFDSADINNVLPNDLGEAAVVEFDDIKVTRMRIKPGWRWSEHIKPMVGTDSCQVRHLGVVTKGRGELAGFHWTKVHGSNDLHDSVDDARSSKRRPDSGQHGHRAIGEVYVLAVAPPWRGSGLGRALTLAGLHHLRRRGLDQVMLYVDASNLPAIRLYEGLGFVRWDTDIMYRTPRS